MRRKQVFRTLVLLYSNKPSLEHTAKNKLYSISERWSRDILNFDFLFKGLGLAFSPHFAYQLLRKIFSMLYSINWPNVIVWLSLLVVILDKICILVIDCPACDVINFDMNLSFLTKVAMISKGDKGIQLDLGFHFTV